MIANFPEGAEEVNTSKEFMELYIKVINQDVFYINTYTYGDIFSSLWEKISDHFNVKVSVIDVYTYDQYLTINHLYMGYYSEGSEFDGRSGIFLNSLVFGFCSFPVTLKEVADHLLSETENGQVAYGGYFDIDFESDEYLDSGCWSESEKMVIGLKKIINSIKGSRNIDLLSFLIKIEHKIDIDGNSNGSFVLEDYSRIFTGPELIKAVKSDDIEQVKKLADISIDIDYKDDYGQTALWYAYDNRCSIEVTKYLFESGADINQINEDAETRIAYDIVAWYDSIEMLKYLEEKGMDINPRDKSIGSFFESAIASGSVEIIKYLVEKGVDVDQIDEDGDRALHTMGYNDWGMEQGHFEIIKCLVDAGADINYPDKNGDTALMLFALELSLEFLKYLVEAGADINHINNKGETILFYISWDQAINVVKYLVESGVDINQTDNYGRTALFDAASKGSIEVVKYLIDSGADIN
jgi:ankyrin repeat protein